MYNDKRRNLESRQKQARENPLRGQILALYGQDNDRSLAAVDLLPLLDGQDELSLAQVAYHVSVLREVELLPERSNPPGVGRGKAV